ncbi:MAG TPA: TauD/TfdA family dioxygenase [Steroidobacteraceae bacterium]
MAHLHVRSPRELAIELNDGQRFALHPIWLRERCRDSRNMDLRTGQRLHDPSDLDLALSITSISEPESGRYRIRFSDGHEADFLGRHLLEEAALAPADHDIPVPCLWDASTGEVRRFAWTENPDDAELHEWLRRFLETGFIVYSGVPIRPGSLLRVGSAFGFTRETNFGALFDVRSTAAASDLAYTSLPLDPHTDNPYRDPVPGVQLLHCLVNETSGGLSTLVDGFAAARALEARDLDAFALLSRTPVRFRYQDEATELVASAVPIELDANGGIVAVHFSPRLDFVPLQPPGQLDAYYRARRAFDHLLRSPEFEIRFLLAAGELLMMDNRRLLHGRTGFDTAEGVRHLQGCYIDLDGPRSLYRVVRRRLAAKRSP